MILFLATRGKDVIIPEIAIYPRAFIPARLTARAQCLPDELALRSKGRGANIVLCTGGPANNRRGRTEAE